MTITKQQIQLIHIAKHQLGMDDDTYRDMLSQFKVTSSKQLTKWQADRLLADLRKKGFKRKAKPRAKTKVKGKFASKQQLDLIAFLADQYQWRTVDGFDLWLQKQADTGKIEYKDGKLLSFWCASWVIERLKHMTGMSRHDISIGITPFRQWLRENPSKTYKDWKYSSKESVSDEPV